MRWVDIRTVRIISSLSLPHSFDLMGRITQRVPINCFVRVDVFTSSSLVTEIGKKSLELSVIECTAGLIC